MSSSTTRRSGPTAGVKDTPKTRDEFFKDLDAIKKKGKAEPIYLPGQNWYFFDGLTIGQGADLVKKEGDKYVSNLSDPKVTAAMDLYKKYQSYSKAPKDKDEATPQQAEVFAKGNVGAFIGMGWEAKHGHRRQQGHRERHRLLHHPG